MMQAPGMYRHTAEEYAAEGITPEMVAAVLPYYYNPLYVQEAADAFSQKLSQYTGQLGATKWHQWTARSMKKMQRSSRRSSGMRLH